MAASLLTLASGRIPLPARLLGGSGLALLAAAWILLDPGHTPRPRLQPVSPAALLLDWQSPWVERAELADPASLFLRSPTDLADLPVTAQPEATPFLAFGPDLRAQPGQPLATRTLAPSPSTQTPIDLLLQPESLPFRTLGQKPALAPPLPRRALAEVVSDSGETMFSQEITEGSVEKKIHKAFSDNILSIRNCPEFRLAIDAFGQQAKPFLLLSSGDSALDQASLEWAAGQDWRRHLPPGSYRLRVGP